MLVQEIRYAIRGLARAKTLTAVILLSLVLGIGVNTAVFSVVNSLLLQPLPYEDSGKLVAIYNPSSSGRKSRLPFSPQDYDDFARQSNSYQSIASYLYIPGMSGIDLTGTGEPQRIPAAYVSGSFFTTLGMQAQKGRVLAAADDKVGADRQIVISDRVWHNTFGGDPAIIGRTVALSEKTFTVVGIMPRSFAFPTKEVDVWAPISLIGDDAIPHTRGLRWMDVVARLRPGVTLEAARSEGMLIMQRLAKAYPDTNSSTNSVETITLRDAMVGSLRTVVLIIFGTVAFVLLIACANIANLLLARSTEREKELAIRSAMGASPGRLVRQALVESLLLSLSGGIAGTIAAVLTLRIVAGMSNRAGELVQQVHLDPKVFAFAAAISVLTGVLFGLLPALRASKAEPQSALSQSSKASGEGRDTRNARSLLVMAEIAVAATVLVASLLAVQSLWRLMRVGPGITTEHVVAVKLRIPQSHLGKPADAMNYRNDLIRSISALPGVLAVGGSKTMPLKGGAEPYGVTAQPPEATTSQQSQSKADVFIVTPGYFKALQIPLVDGREFISQDERKESPAVIVNERWAKLNWPGESAIGKKVYFGKDTAMPVVGVAADVHNDGLDKGVAPVVYAPAGFFPRSSLHLFVRTSQDPLSLAGAIRSAVWQVDKNEPVEITTLDDVLSTSTAQPRMVAGLLAAFGAIALLLAGVGVYGVLAYNVRRKLHDIGVRIALGAQRSDVVRLVIGESLRLTAAGLVVGTAAALAGTRVMQSVLFGIAPFDPVTYVVAIVLLMVVALAASALPTLRALRVDPVAALRAE